MAMNAGVPIVPVSISGSARVMPKGKFEIHPGVVRITVHDSVPSRGSTPPTPDDYQRIMAQVRQAILSGLS